jgi:predicted type IV restriction endonuclease
MAIDKRTLAKLKKFAGVFKAAQERKDNESDTIMFVIEFFKEVLQYDPLTHEIRKEVPIKERYCDFSVVLKNKTRFLVEAKGAGTKRLSEKNIEQAENYASRAPIEWVLLTNGVEWQLYHLTFDKEKGIVPDLVFEVKNFVEEVEKSPDSVWDKLSVLGKDNILDNSLETYYEQTKLLSKKNIVKILLSEAALAKVRRALNQKASARLEMRHVFDAVRDVLSQEAIAEAGDINPPIKKHHHHHHANKAEEMEAQALPPSSPEQSQTEQEIPS